MVSLRCRSLPGGCFHSWGRPPVRGRASSPLLQEPAATVVTLWTAALSSFVETKSKRGLAWIWTSLASASGPVLDDAAYRGLLRQSQNVKPYTYHAVQGQLFDDIVMQKLPPGEGPPRLEN